MGYSCTKVAMDTLNALMNLIRSPEQPTNTWFYKGQEYFYEIGRENYDYSITGSVFRIGPNSTAKKVSPFKISRDGKIVRFPHIPKEIRNKFRD